MSAEIAVRLLGPLEVELSGEPVRLDGVKRRRLLVLLALRAPEPVSDDELLEALWGEAVPTGAAQTLQRQISRLRSQLGDASAVRRRHPGYALDVDPLAVDSHRFEHLLRRARSALAREEP